MLGFLISGESIRMDLDKPQDICEWLVPKYRKEIQQILE
jgi:hypothetical protein